MFVEFAFNCFLLNAPWLDVHTFYQSVRDSYDFFHGSKTNKNHLGFQWSLSINPDMFFVIFSATQLYYHAYLKEHPNIECAIKNKAVTFNEYLKQCILVIQGLYVDNMKPFLSEPDLWLTHFLYPKEFELMKNRILQDNITYNLFL